ncbi:hypothetical protein IAD21_00215 [Abditibacteriota bacterium]|nr:hypothetical protein IAD21_00215 [Abditibacteriota bacterium]
MLKSSRGEWKIILWPLVGVGIAFGLWHSWTSPRLIAVKSTDAHYSVAMIYPSTWQLYRGESPYRLELTFYLRDTLNKHQKRVTEKQDLGCFSNGDRQEPTNVWWRSDSQAFLFITRYQSGHYSWDAYDVHGHPVSSTVEDYLNAHWWVEALIQEKRRNGTASQKIISQQFLHELEETKAYIKQYTKKIKRRK